MCVSINMWMKSCTLQVRLLELCDKAEGFALQCLILLLQ